MSGTLIPIDGPTICNEFIFSGLETPEAWHVGVWCAFTTPSKQQKKDQESTRVARFICALYQANE